MGAGILPTAVHNNKLYFLFGKENEYEKTAPGWSDFGGGKDNSETLLQTGIREGSEELTGFLGNPADIKKLLKHGTFDVDYHFDEKGTNVYRSHIFPMEYDEKLPYYYNNNARFLHEKLNPSIIKTTKIFEKIEIKWVSIDDLSRTKNTFRWYYREIINNILKHKNEITEFIMNALKKKGSKRKRRTFKNK
jgi:transcription termination factor NusB